METVSGTASCGKWSVRLNHLDPALTACKKPLLLVSNGRQVIWNHGGEKHHPGAACSQADQKESRCRCGPRSPGEQSNPVASLVASRSGPCCLACCEKLRIVGFWRPSFGWSPHTTRPKPACPRSRDPSQSTNVNVRTTSRRPPVEKDCIRRGTQCGWDPIGQPTGGVGLFRDGIFWRGWPTFAGPGVRSHDALCHILDILPCMYRIHRKAFCMYSVVSVKPRRTLGIWSMVCASAPTRS